MIDLTPTALAQFGHSLCDVGGLRIGHAQDENLCSGVTLILPDHPVVMAVDVRGGGPGTRETDALATHNLVERVHGLVLAGGSVFGLGAADSIVDALSARGIGLALGARAVPVVPAAVIYDLGNGGDKNWARSPYPALGERALAALEISAAQGAVGAGVGARAGSRVGGIGMASCVSKSGARVAALMVVNSFGEVYADAPPSGDVPMPKMALGKAVTGMNTCIGVVATDAPLLRVQAQRMAMMAHDGLARAIRPIHTPFDGDSIFAISTAEQRAQSIDALQLAELGTLAADCVLHAVRRAVVF